MLFCKQNRVVFEELRKDKFKILLNVERNVLLGTEDKWVWGTVRVKVLFNIHIYILNLIEE